MTATQIIGLLLVCMAGVLAGTCSAPIKVMRRFQYEQWAFVSQFFSLILFPWVSLLLLCPDAFSAFGELPVSLFVRANLLSLAWGVANILVTLCLVRVGFSLTIGLMTGIGLPVGVLLPMMLRGSGEFSKAPSLFSPAGLIIIGGVLLLLVAVRFITLAGFGRDKALQHSGRQAGDFVVSMVMIIVAGFLQVGLSSAFVYSQGPVITALHAHGAGDIAANIGVWAIALPAGALVNVLYPAWLLTRRRSWGELAGNLPDIGLCLLIAVLFFAFIISNGQGQRMIGPLGASIGFGIYQALQISASQAVGFISGEWNGVHGRPRMQMLFALALLLLAVGIMAYGNAVA